MIEILSISLTSLSTYSKNYGSMFIEYGSHFHQNDVPGMAIVCLSCISGLSYRYLKGPGPGPL